MKSRLKQFPTKLILACALAAALPAGQAMAETCLSPYIKGLKQPEKVMYLWTLPATPNGGPDFLAVIDVNLASATYGKILKKVHVGSSGNEAHHMGYTDDRTKIWAASLNSNRFFIFDVVDRADKLRVHWVRADVEDKEAVAVERRRPALGAIVGVAHVMSLVCRGAHVHLLQGSAV